MRSKQILLTIFCVLLLLSLSATAAAQPRDFDHGGRPGKHFMKHHGMPENFENLRLIKLLEALDLNDEQTPEFIATFHSFRRDIRDIRQQKEELIDRLTNLIDAGDDSATVIPGVIEEIKRLHRSDVERHFKFFDATNQVLTPVQQGKLIVFQERFEREVLETIREFRRKRFDSPGDEKQP